MTRPYLAAAAAIAVELDHAAYGGVYLAVAEAHGLKLVTADDRLLRKAGQGRLAPHLIALAAVA